MPRPSNDERHPDAAFEQIGLLAPERPSVRKPFTAVVAGEHDDRVVGNAGSFQFGQDRTDRTVESHNDFGVFLQRPAVAMKKVLRPSLGIAVGRTLPRPMRRGEMEADEERAVDLDCGTDFGLRPFRQSIEVDRLQEHAARFEALVPADLGGEIAVAVDADAHALADHQRLVGLDAKTALADVGYDPRDLAPLRIDQRRAVMRRDSWRPPDLPWFTHNNPPIAHKGG